MNVIDALVEHHEEIRKIFSEVEQNPDLLSKLKNHLVIHHTNEEDYLLSKLRTMKDIKPESLESIEEHHILDMMLNDLEDFPKNNERWKVKFGILKEYTEHHLQEEEDDIFGVAKEKLSEAELENLGNNFIKHKTVQLEAMLE